MKCSICNKFIWFWQEKILDKNMKPCHFSCFEDCQETLELERKTKIHVKKESERLEKKRLDDARIVRESSLGDSNEEASSGAEKKMDDWINQRIDTEEEKK